jgi:hypothetical protein
MRAARILGKTLAKTAINIAPNVTHTNMNGWMMVGMESK